VNVESHATVLLVDDVAAALEYYGDKLGFEGHAWEDNLNHYGYASRGGCHVHFCHAEGAGPTPNHIVFPPDMCDLYVYVDDVDALHEELVERGAEILHAPVDTEYGMRDFRVRDPHGYILAFGKVPE
jgi:catechol 2,3-dioxygenase-like lactoylglutathione lyase family enzyme